MNHICVCTKLKIVAVCFKTHMCIEVNLICRKKSYILQTKGKRKQAAGCNEDVPVDGKLINLISR